MKNKNFYNIIKYYCYPNEKVPSKIYENMDEYTEMLLLKAAGEFILNVRLKNNHPIQTWSNHENMWDPYQKNSL